MDYFKLHIFPFFSFFLLSSQTLSTLNVTHVSSRKSYGNKVSPTPVTLKAAQLRAVESKQM